MTRTRLAAAVVGVALTLTTATGCVSSGGGGGGGGQPAGNAWGTATSAATAGGMDALVAAAKQEGALNVIALPPDWANYGALIDGFQKKYGITVNSANPEGSSQDEINAVQQLGTQDRAPDVLDLGQSFANKNVALFAPYQVATWDAIPAGNKDANGAWVNDYGGFISIGCNATIVKKCPTTFKELLDPQYKGQVALNGNPTQAAAAFSGVWAASLSNGGSLDDIGPGIDFFVKVKDAGNFNPVEVTPATVQNGETPLAIDWDYVNAGLTETLAADNVDWQVNVPTDGLFGSFYSQAINKFAPHPAAARLWEEFLYSDEGQNIWLKGLSRPVRLQAMIDAGTVDDAAVKALPAVDGEVEFPDDDQQSAAQKVVADRWNAEMSG